MRDTHGWVWINGDILILLSVSFYYFLPKFCTDRAATVLLVTNTSAQPKFLSWFKVCIVINKVIRVEHKLCNQQLTLIIHKVYIISDSLCQQAMRVEHKLCNQQLNYSNHSQSLYNQWQSYVNKLWEWSTSFATIISCDS